jgi:hypothetical protein
MEVNSIFEQQCFPKKIVEKYAHPIKTAHSGDGIEKNRPWAVFRRNTVIEFIEEINYTQ